MALNIDEMSDAIFTELESSLSSGVAFKEEAWQKLSYAIAKGVITHIKNNADVIKVKVDASSHAQSNKGKIE